MSEGDPQSFSALQAQGSDASSPVLMLMQMGILGILLVLVGLRWKRILRASVKVPLCWAIPLLAILSTGWSVIPDVTFKRGIYLAGATLIGVYWAVRYPLATQMRLLAWGLGPTAVSCFVFTLLFPNFGIEVGDHAGAWRGLFHQKNILARIMVLGGLTFLWLVLNRERQRLLWWGGLLVTIALLILSTSKTALLVMVVLVGCVPLFRAMRGKSLRIWLSLALGMLCVSCVALVLIDNAEVILTALGRDVTLTGRTGIWDIVIEKISARPWFGYGYKSFWLGMEGESADVWYVTFFLAPHAHNGYLDLMLDLGLVGFSLFAISLTGTIGRAIVWLRQQSQPMVGIGPLLFLTYLLLYNITESSLILEPNTLFWLLYVNVSTVIQTQVIETDQKTVPNSMLIIEESSHA